MLALELGRELDVPLPTTAVDERAPHGRARHGPRRAGLRRRLRRARRSCAGLAGPVALMARPRPARRHSTWLELYERMLTIRVFEEQVNELYTTARRCRASPTSTSARRRSRSASARRCGATTTSRAPTAATATAWPRAPPSTGCSPSCSARRPATAAARAARCTSPTTQTGNLGANAIVGGCAGIATGAALSAQDARQRPGRGLLLRRGRARPGAALRGHEHGRALEAAGRSTSARTTSTASTRTTARRPPASIDARAPRRSASRRARSTARTCGPSTTPRRMPSSARGAATGPAFLLCETYRYHGHHVGDVDRAYYRSTEEEEQLARASATDRAARRAGCSSDGSPTRTSSQRSRRECAEVEAGRRVRARRAVSRRRARWTKHVYA